MADEYIERITSFLTSHGITTFHFEHLAKHRAVVIPYNGRSNRVVFPLTGSDWRGPANTVSTIRHVLGLFQAKAPQAANSRRPHRHKTAAHRQRHVARVTFRETPAPQPDKFLGPLLILKARFEAAKAAADDASAGIELTAPSARSVRIRLRTPWLGRQTRHATI
jgi:hypothetical protein